MTFDSYSLKKYYGPSVWSQEDIKCRHEQWTYTLSEQECLEIVSTSERVANIMPDMRYINNKTFELPTLSTKFEQILDQLEYGLGIFLIKNFPVDALDRNILVGYMGTLSQLGNLVPQTPDKDLYMDVHNCGATIKNRKLRDSDTDSEIKFHTDISDVTSLLCVSKSEYGGESRLASSGYLHNLLLDQSETLLQELYCGLPQYSKYIKSNDWILTPIFHDYKNRLITSFHPLHNYSELPLSAEQFRAIRLLYGLSEAKENFLEFTLDRGDILMLNNKTVLHARNHFTDSEENKRHLIRLWVCSKRSIELPPIFENKWGSITIGNRGGYLRDL